MPLLAPVMLCPVSSEAVKVQEPGSGSVLSHIFAKKSCPSARKRTLYHVFAAIRAACDARVAKPVKFLLLRAKVVPSAATKMPPRRSSFQPETRIQSPNGFVLPVLVAVILNSQKSSIFLAAGALTGPHILQSVSDVISKKSAGAPSSITVYACTK